MMKSFGKLSSALAIAAFSLLLTGPTAFAIDTFQDWTGANTTAANNNYSVLSPTGAGGQFAGVIPSDPNVAAHYFLADQTLSTPGGIVNFTNELHMSGTMTFSNPGAILPNLLFGWFDKDDTRHRIGLGFANITTAPDVPQANHLRIDLGYAATGGNYFPYTSANGMVGEANHNSILPDGSYHFTFDYVPGPSGMPGGSLSATVGNFFHVTQPIGTLQPGIPGTTSMPWDTDIFELDSFGFVQRYRSSFPGNGGPYSLIISDVTYTGGTAAPTPTGDFDSNGHVNGADLDIWKPNFGALTGGTLATGDADGDQDVDGRDFLIWQRTHTGTSATAVPEPAAIALVTLAAMATSASRTRRRQ